VAALAALPLSSKAQSVGDLRLLSELPSAVRRYGANAEVTFKVVDTGGKPVEGVSVCGVNTDSAGLAVYRGIVVNGQLQVAVSSPDIYSPTVAPIVFSELSDDNKSFAPTNMQPIVVRRKVKPHEMVRGSVNFWSIHRERPMEGKYETEWFNVETGMFPGVSDNMGYGNLMAGYVILEPKSPEDGFQEIEAYPDSLGTPLVAPTDGYTPGVFEMMFREDRSNRSGEGVRLIAFRHKTSAGFVYGVVKMNGRFCNNLEYIVNSVAGEQSLEAEERRWSSFR
jgi:hypothetical protein